MLKKQSFLATRKSLISVFPDGATLVSSPPLTGFRVGGLGGAPFGVVHLILLAKSDDPLINIFFKFLVFVCSFNILLTCFKSFSVISSSCLLSRSCASLNVS